MCYVYFLASTERCHFWSTEQQAVDGTTPNPRAAADELHRWLG